MLFAVPADNRLKLEENEKRDKYLDIVSQLKKKRWNMKVTFITILISALGAVTEGLIKGQEDLEISGRVEAIQTTTLLRTARILRRVFENRGDLLSLKTSVKNSVGANNNNNDNILVEKMTHRELCKKLKFDPRTNGICTTQNLTGRMRRKKFSRF